MLENSNLSEENLTACYENWSQLNLQQNVAFGAGNTKYNASGQAGRNTMVNTYNWTITDGGLLETPFIIEIDSTESGVSNADQFQFTGAVGDYDVIAKQNDIVVANFNDLSNQETITLPSAGIYDLEVFPKASNGFNRIQFDNNGDRKKILDTKNWGDIVWNSFENAFYGCNYMTVTATDVPNLSSVTSLKQMFRICFLANPDVSNWDTSNVTNMERMFWDTRSANPDVSNWDTSNVTEMGDMFREASNANPNVTNWDVGNVRGMALLFAGSNASPNVTNWDVSSCEDMRNLFGNTPGNPNVSNWDVSSVERMGNMFNDATNANPDCRNWNVINLNDAGDMFEGSALSVENLTSIYENWSQLNLQQNISFSAGSTKYNSSGQAGRDILVNTYNWTITDGGLLETPFIIEIDSTESGVSNNNQFQFTGAEGDYDVVAKQNDIVVTTFDNLSGAETITLPSSGVYDLEVFPKASNGFNRIAFNGGGDRLKITDIKQWGDVVWSSFGRAFWACENMLVTATDIPNLSNVTNMRSMFLEASSANPDTSNWDVSSVTNMSEMFRDATSANPDTSNWDVGNVTNMRSMFENASSANPDTSNWDVSSVTDMSFMFYFAQSANPDTSNWDVSSVTNMFIMFLGASSANPDVSNWDVSSVTNMGYIFSSATSANPDVSNWDVSSVTNMYRMFRDATSANPDVSNWDVSSVTNMFSMFENSNLSVENLTSIYENWSQLNLQQNVAFGAGNTKYNASGQAGRNTMVNTYNWTITDGGLLETPFIIEIDSTESGVSNSDQFQFTGAEGDYDVVAKQNDIVVANFNDLSNQETITLPSSGVYVLEVKSKEVNGFNRIAFDNGGDKDKIIDIKQWGDVVWSSFEESFIGCSNLLATATDAPDLSNVTNMGYMFLNASSANPDTSNWDVSNVTSMNRMFFGATSANPDTSNWDVGSVTNMRSMFKNAFSANPDVSNWDVSNVTSMNRMFFGATSANPNTLNWDVSSVTIMDRMLENSNLSEENLTAIYENWSQLNLQQNVTFSAGTIKYNSSGQAGRDILVNTYNWTIEDGGQV